MTEAATVLKAAFSRAPDPPPPPPHIRPQPDQLTHFSLVRNCRFANNVIILGVNIEENRVDFQALFVCFLVLLYIPVHFVC